MQELLTCVCVSLCTTVVHNTAHSSSDYLPSYPPDKHQSSDAVYWRGRGLQPMPKAVYHSGSRDKHNCPRWDSSLISLTPQDSTITVWHTIANAEHPLELRQKTIPFRFAWIHGSPSCASAGHSQNVTQAHLLLLARLMGQYCFAGWRLPSSVTLPAGELAGRQARRRSGGRQCTAGKYGYVPLGRIPKL